MCGGVKTELLGSEMTRLLPETCEKMYFHFKLAFGVYHAAKTKRFNTLFCPLGVEKSSRGRAATPQEQKHLSLQEASGFVQRAFIIIRNVIALLLLKDRGWGRKGMEPGDRKIRAGH